MQKYELYNYLKIGGGTFAAVLFYSWLWKKSRPICLLMMVIGLAGLVYFTLDWNYWKDYFIVNPDNY